MDPTRPNPYGYAPRGGYRPFRPNHYNRPPPGMPYGNIPPQQPPPHFPNLKLGGYPQPPLRPPPPMMAPPPTFDMNLNNNKLNTLFVGAIAVGVQDEWIEQLLKACGSLIEWKRVKDQAGNPKGFGFATYQDPDSVLRALRILGGEENNKGVVLKAQDGSQVEKKLIVKADDNVRNYLNHYKSSRAAVTDEKEKDEKSLEKVDTIIHHIHSGKKVEDVKEMDITSQPSSASSSLVDTTVNIDDNKEGNEKQNIMDALGKDLAFLREQATKASSSQDQQNNTHERHRSISEEENLDHHHQRHRHHRHHHDEDRRQQQRKRQEFVKGHTEQLSIEDYDPELEKDDEEAERRKQEKYQKEMEITFRQREKRFEQRELTRLEEHEHNLKKSREDQERRLNEREFWAKRLAEWDDDIEMKNDDNEFYNDRSRWRKARLHLKRREEERDEEDRRLAMDTDKTHEKENISNSRDQSPSNAEYLTKKQNNTELSNTQSPSSSTATPSLPASPIKVTPTKLKTTKINLGQLPTKRMGGNLGDDDDDDDNGRKRRVLIPLDYSEIKDEDTLMEDIQNQTTTDQEQQQQQEEKETQDIPILSEEERNKKIKELISSIPSSEDQLWKWDIRWDVLNEDVMNTKLQPFVAKKILELVGTEEDELITFILDSVRKHTAPVDLVTELEMTLDEDALVFVMKLWRTIIFETERLARHL